MESVTWAFWVATALFVVVVWFLGVVALVSLLYGREALFERMSSEILFRGLVLVVLFLWLVLGFTGMHWIYVGVSP